jgi:hypothetical protein
VYIVYLFKRGACTATPAGKIWRSGGRRERQRRVQHWEKKERKNKHQSCVEGCVFVYLVLLILFKGICGVSYQLHSSCSLVQLLLFDFFVLGNAEKKGNFDFFL